MATNGALIAILAAQAQAERRAFEAFRVAGATAPERARGLEALGITDSVGLRTLTKRGLVREAEPGLFWLDERAVAERSRPPKGLVRVVIVLLVVIGLAAVAGMMLQ
ncbi:MAG TPA: hypothetical protein VF613_02695 [Longimicrobium sp.]|jgi:hypothetical protein